MRDAKLADDPADTRMMGIVHAALKRDLTASARGAASRVPPRGPAAAWRSAGT